jgi:hypothetical protein
MAKAVCALMLIFLVSGTLSLLPAPREEGKASQPHAQSG